MRTPQELAAEIKKIAKEQKIVLKTMLSDCGLSINTLSSMQAGGYFPRLEAIAKISEYLGCSLDYLLYGEHQEKEEKLPFAQLKPEQAAVRENLLRLVEEMSDDQVIELTGRAIHLLFDGHGNGKNDE